jgi:hypothetical protein
MKKQPVKKPRFKQVSEETYTNTNSSLWINLEFDGREYILYLCWHSDDSGWHGWGAYVIQGWEDDPLWKPPVAGAYALNDKFFLGSWEKMRIKFYDLEEVEAAKTEALKKAKQFIRKQGGHIEQNNSTVK